MSVREACCETAGSLVHAAPSPGSSPEDSGAMCKLTLYVQGGKLTHWALCDE